MKKIILFIFSITIISFTTQAQKNKYIIDSIENVIKTQSNEALVKSYSELTWQYRTVNRAKAIDYGYKGIALAKKINFHAGLAQVYNDLGIIYYDKEQYDSSIYLYNESLKIRQTLHDDLGVAKLYNKIGIIYQRQGLFSDALYNQQNALALFEKENYAIGISYSLNNIGILQQNMGRLDEALLYHNQSLTIKKKLNDSYGLIQSYINIANIFKIKEEFVQAEEYYKNAIALSREMDNKEYLANGLNNLGNLQYSLNKLRESKQNILESYAIRTTLNNTKGRVSCLNNLATVLIALKQYDSAENVLNYAENLALNAVNTKPELISIYQTKSTLYEKLDNATASLNYYKKYAAYKDSLYNNDMSSKFSELEIKYNTAQKEKLIQQQQASINKNLYDISKQKLLLSQNELEIAANDLAIKKQDELILKQRLDSTKRENQIIVLNREKKIDQLKLNNEKLINNRKNILLIVIGVIALLTIWLIYSLYRRYRLHKEKQLQEAILKQEQLAATAIIKAEENERKRIAEDLHDGVGQLMSAVKMNLSAIENDIPFSSEEQKNAYKKVLNMVDESCKEVRSVSHSMMPNALLKTGLEGALKEFLHQINSQVLKVNLYTEGLQNKLASNTETILYRVIQECINNVLKHAQANNLDISVIKDNHEIAVTIEDDGKGFSTNTANNSEGIGLKNIKTRIEYLKGMVEWNSAPGKGTLVAIHVPVT
ncbi:MAG: sensor histidine kinase [Chitinophagaceae bacterium]|nr:sensor histidine kinase [Chitinophagaceae bacterium]MCW5904564.1 sensor histidine kinase [Chitinophagaceae bacterium]